MKKTSILSYTCFQCDNAYLMRSEVNNPVVSECQITRQREVANTRIECPYFKKRIEEAEIHSMIPCK